MRNDKKERIFHIKDIEGLDEHECHQINKTGNNFVFKHTSSQEKPI